MTSRNQDIFSEPGIQVRLNPRWSWAAKAACAAIPGASIFASTVQIAQTGNLVSTNAGAGGLDGDFTGEMSPIPVLTGAVMVSSFSTRTYATFTSVRFIHGVSLQIDSSTKGKVQGYNVFRYSNPGTYDLGFFYLFSEDNYLIVYSATGNPYSRNYLVPLTFTDARINQGQPTSGFLDINAFSSSFNDHTLEITRLVFDDESPSAPEGVSAGGNDPDWAPAPEIDVLGNGTSISSGDVTPDASDHTDFGESPQGVPVVRTFEIKNVGPLDLTVTSTSISPGDFSSGNVSGTVTPGNSLNLQVTFTPTALGERTATVTIMSNDSNEGTYTFDISGVGLEAPVDPPDPTVIVVTNNSNVVLAISINNKIKKLKKKFKKVKSSGNKAKAKKIKGQIKKLKKKLASL